MLSPLNIQYKPYIRSQAPPASLEIRLLIVNANLDPFPYPAIRPTLQFSMASNVQRRVTTMR